MQGLALRLLAMGMVIVGAGAARAQGLYPPTGGGLPIGGGMPGAGVGAPAGVDTRVGDLRGYFNQAFGNVPAPEVATRSYTFTAGLDVSEIYDTDAVQSSSHGTHDLITRISPSIGVSIDAARITGSLFYAPSIDFYAYHGNQNNIAQNLNAAATAVLVPDWLFLDVRAYASQASITGYNGPNTVTPVSQSNQVQTTSFSAAPTLRHTFGSTATVEAGTIFSRTAYNSGNNTVIINNGFGNIAEQLNQTQITSEEHASVSTGEDFGRFNDTLSGYASQSTGQGTLTTAHQQVFSNHLAYAVSYSVILTASIGHETIHYGGPTPYNLNDVIWSGGVRLLPNPDSTIDVGYGRQQGDTSFYLNANYAWSPQTHVFATYTEGIGTNAGFLQNAVSGTTVGPNGVTFNPITNTPVLLNNNFAGTRPGLFRTKTASAGVLLVHPRDIYNLTFNYTDSTQLVTGVEGSTANNSNTSTYGSISWSHDLSTDLRSNALLQYRHQQRPRLLRHRILELRPRQPAAKSRPELLHQ